MAGAPRLILYERDGCHLCEEAGLLLDEMIGVDRYARVDIDADDDLVVRYGFRIPVITLDGIDRLEAPISRDDVQALAAALAGDR
jgi:hypothetical protein